jgi:hypothetical protein
MADKKIVISGQLNIDASKAVKALEDVSKKFKSFEKSAFTKQMEDMRKLQPLIKDLDKGLSKMMQSMTKSDAKSRIKELNQALKQQADELKKVLEVQEKLNRSIKEMPDGSARDQKRAERDDASYKARSLMGSMEQFGSEREELKKLFTTDFIKKIAQGVQMTAGIAGSVGQFVGNRESTRLALEAQSAGFGNMVGSMAYGKNIDLGTVMASGKLGNIDKAMKDRVTGKGIGMLGEMVSDTAGGAANGAQGGAGGALLNGLGGLLGSAAKNANGLSQKEFFSAISSQAGVEGMQNVLSETSFPRELMNMLIDQAPMKVAAMQGMVGAGEGAHGKGLGKMFGQNYRRATRFGVEMPEAAGMMQMMGQSGAIGAERGDISGMLQARNSGVAQAGEFAGMVSGVSKISGDGSKNVSIVRKAIEDGVRTGVDRSMVKNLVRATEEIAGSYTSKIGSEEQFASAMNQIRMALGNADMSKVGVSQLETAKGAIDAVNEDMNTPMGLAIRNMTMADYATQIGGNQMSPDLMIALSKMKAGETLQEGSPLRDMLKNDVFGGDENKLFDFESQLPDLQRLSALKSRAMYSDTAAGINTLDKLHEFQGDLQSTDPDKRKAAEERLKKLQLSEGNFLGSQEKGQYFGNFIAGHAQDLKDGKLEDESGQTGAGGLARYRAALESLQQAAAGQKDVQDKMKEAMSAQLEAAKRIAEPGGILQKMEDGTSKLTISMDDLKKSVDALNLTMGGKLPDRAKDDKQTRDKEFNEKRQTIGDALDKGNYFEAGFDALSTVPDLIQQGWDKGSEKVNNKLVPSIRSK